MDQQDLWHDNLEDALRAVVHGLGGPKKVAHELWPARSITEAARLLNHCLDPERAEKLSLSELLLILRRGSEEGIHTGMAYIADFCRYEPPRPVTKDQQVANLQRQLLDMGKELRGALARLEKVERDV